MSEKKSSGKGCLIFLGISTFAIVGIVIFFILNWDTIQEDSNNAHDQALSNIDTINYSLQEVQSSIENFSTEDSLLLISRDILLDNETMLYCTWADVSSINGNKIDNHFVYNDIQSYQELLNSEQENWNVFEAEDITEKMLKMTHVFVVKLDSFELPQATNEDTFLSGIAKGNCYVLDLTDYSIIGHAPFTAYNSEDISFGGGVDISIGKIIPVGNIGGTEFEEAITSDFYDNCNTAINGTWLKMD